MSDVKIDPIKDEDYVCPKSGSGEHVVDWDSIHIDDDDERYIDVVCVECGHTGCLGSAKNLEENMQW